VEHGRQTTSDGLERLGLGLNTAEFNSVSENMPEQTFDGSPVSSMVVQFGAFGMVQTTGDDRTVALGLVNWRDNEGT
jgi:hypothetical protein